ncbi:MAG: hypothetical protein GYA24_08930, partial [Candidatus Lokiarchaeota archaeon]|nr:hypothetical protein [Candidatus Lokiarchaeota archaeon]
QEIKYLFFLMFIADKPEGITGYQLQEKHAIPRVNLVRTSSNCWMVILSVPLDEKGNMTRITVEMKKHWEKYIIITLLKSDVTTFKDATSTMCTSCMPIWLLPLRPMVSAGCSIMRRRSSTFASTFPIDCYFLFLYCPDPAPALPDGDAEETRCKRDAWP